MCLCANERSVLLFIEQVFRKSSKKVLVYSNNKVVPLNGTDEFYHSQLRCFTFNKIVVIGYVINKIHNYCNRPYYCY